MKHRLLAIGVFLVSVGILSADTGYLLIIANLGEAAGKQAEAPPPRPGPGGLPPIGPLPSGPGSKKAGAVLRQGGADSVPFHVVSIVDVTLPSKQSMKDFESDRAGKFKHKWTDKEKAKSGSYLIARTPVTMTAILKIDKKPVPDVLTRFEKKFQANKPGGYTADQLVEIAEWALSHGLVGKGKQDKVALVLDKLVENLPAHPVAVAYVKLKADLARPVPAGDPAALPVVKKLLDGVQTRESPHFLLIHDLSGPNASSSVDSRLDRLEEAFRTFYYWFALRSTNLALPRERLVAVLTVNPKEYDRLYEILTAGWMVAGAGAPPKDEKGVSLPVRPLTTIAQGDGFLGRRLNVLVMSAKRLDEEYDALDKYSDSLFRTFNKHDMLRGIINKKAMPDNMENLELQVAKAMTLALMLKAMEQDAEAAACSHVVPRQLLYALGMLPRNVAVPEWVEFGMGSFFESSAGSPWPTPGGVNIQYKVPFHELQKAHKLEATFVDTLRMIVTDGYFRRLVTASDKPATLRKARITAWALTYFLAQKKLDGLRRYFTELSKMPRDMELSDEQLLTCFARAFDCIAVSTNKVDNVKLTKLAAEWDQLLRTTPVEDELKAVDTIVQETLKAVAGGNGGPRP